MVEQLGLGHDAADAMQKQIKQPEFLSRQIDRLASDIGRASHRIKRDITMAQFGGRLTCRAPHQGAQPGRNFINLKWLGHVVVSSGIQALDLLGPAVARRQNQDGRRAARTTPAPQDLDSGQPRQSKIEHNRVKLLLQRKGQTLLAVLYMLDDKPEAAQPFLQAGTDVLIVLDKQNANGPFSRLQQLATRGG